MYKYFLLIALIVCSFSVSAQWQQTGSKVRYVTGIGIPTKDTAAGVLADSSQILIRPADSSLYVKYKRTWLRVGGGGGSISGGGSFNYIPKFTSSSSIGNSLIYDDGSLIGIGTATPNTFLDVRGSATFKATSPRIFIDDNDNNGTASIWFRPQNASFNIRGAIDLISAGSGAAGEFRFSAGSTGGTGNAAHYMSFYTAALERMRIDVAGNVGIGTASPVAKLDVVGSAGIRVNEDGAGTKVIQIRSNFAGVDPAINVSTNNSLLLQTNNTERMRITSAGDVGIGTTSPAAKLSVQGTTLINTNTDNGVDKLQVNGSVLSTQYKLSALNTAPASATAAGTTGEIRIDANYIYICTATNTWKRVAIATW